MNNVFYSEYNSPIGELTLFSAHYSDCNGSKKNNIINSYIIKLMFENDNKDDYIYKLLNNGTEVSHERDRMIEQCENELTRYFNGDLRHFSIRKRFSGTPYQLKIWNALSLIPYGQTITYSHLCREADVNEKSVRAAGNAVGKNPIPIILPCHRVLRSDGSLGGFRGGLAAKNALLKIEGIIP